MKLYLNNRLKNAEIKKSYKRIALVTLLMLVIAVIVSEIIGDSFGKKGLHPAIYLVFIIISVLTANYKTFNKLKIIFNTTDKELLKIIIDFLKEFETDEREIKSSVKNIFSIYPEKNIDKYSQEYISSKININETCLNLSKASSDVKYFLLHTLLELSAKNRILSIDEENYITKVRKGLNIHELTYNNIKSIYIKQGLKEERKIIENQYRKKTSESFSEIFYPYNAYKVLRVSPSVTKAQLKKAYRTLAKKYHPDKFHGQSEEAVQHAEDKFQEITEAYNVIKKFKEK